MKHQTQGSFCFNHLLTLWFNSLFAFACSMAGIQFPWANAFCGLTILNTFVYSELGM